MATGLIKFYNESKGYGFLIADADFEELFFHVTAYAEDADLPVKGQRVTFDRATSRDGRPCAEKVSPAD